jgi:hypothetical protein
MIWATHVLLIIMLELKSLEKIEMQRSLGPSSFKHGCTDLISLALALLNKARHCAFESGMTSSWHNICRSEGRRFASGSNFKASCTRSPSDASMVCRFDRSTFAQSWPRFTGAK